MSGCHPPETLAVCKHGNPFKFPCLHCAPTHSEFTMIDMIKAMEELRHGISALHEFKLKQIEENNKLLKEIRELQRFQDITHLEYMNKSQPYKCPVCLGEIKILIDPSTPLSGIQAMFGKRNENGIYYKDCHACEGKGIVWG